MTSLEALAIFEQNNLRSALNSSFLGVIFATVLKDSASKNGTRIYALSVEFRSYIKVCVVFGKMQSQIMCLSACSKLIICSTSKHNFHLVSIMPMVGILKYKTSRAK